MTEAQAASDPAAVWAQIEAEHAARARLAEEALPLNKTALFDALAAAGVTSVVVTFDGCGDEGQIESMDAFDGQGVVDLPTVAIGIATPAWDGLALERKTLTVIETIEALAYAFLADTHCGWENNEGAFGEFTFDVGERTIDLDYNERIETSEYQGHSW